MRFYTVIYDVIDDVEQALRGMLKPEYEEVVIGRAEVREIFRSSKAGTIAGSMVESGLIRRNATARLVRDGKVVSEAPHGRFAASLHRRCHRGPRRIRMRYRLGKFNDIREGDIIENYEMQENHAFSLYTVGAHTGAPQCKLFEELFNGRSQRAARLAQRIKVILAEALQKTIRMIGSIMSPLPVRVTNDLSKPPCTTPSTGTMKP